MLQPYSQALNSLTRLYFKTPSVQLMSPLSEADPNILETNAESHFSKDCLGYFSSHTQQDLLTLARVPKEKHQDLFMQYAVTTVSKQHESMIVRHLTLQRDAPETLAITKKLKIKEETQVDEIDDNFVVIASHDKTPKDTVISALSKAGTNLDELFKEHVDNKNNLSPEARKKDLFLHIKAQQHLREIHAAYVREQDNPLPDEEFIRIFTGRDSFLGESARQEAFITDNSSASEQALANTTFAGAVQNLKTFIGSDRMELVPTIRKDNFIDKAYDFLSGVDGFDFTTKIGAAWGGPVGAMVVGVAHFILRFGVFSVRQKIEAENAFRKTLKNHLELVLNEVDMPNNSPGVSNANFGLAARVINENLIDNKTVSTAQTNAINDQSTAISGLRDEVNSLKQVVTNAVRLLSSSSRNNSSASLVSIPESLDVGQLQLANTPRTSPRAQQGNFPANPTPGAPPRHSTPELIEELGKKFEAKIEALEEKHAREKAELREEAKKDREETNNLLRQQQEMFAAFLAAQKQ